MNLQNSKDSLEKFKRYVEHSKGVLTEVSDLEEQLEKLGSQAVDLEFYLIFQGLTSTSTTEKWSLIKTSIWGKESSKYMVAAWEDGIAVTKCVNADT